MHSLRENAPWGLQYISSPGTSKDVDGNHVDSDKIEDPKGLKFRYLYDNSAGEGTLIYILGAQSEFN